MRKLKRKKSKKSSEDKDEGSKVRVRIIRIKDITEAKSTVGARIAVRTRTKSKSMPEKKQKKSQELISSFILKTVTLLLIIGLNWAGLSAVIETIAYYNDTENSSGDFTAGELDFYLSSLSDFSPGAIARGESATRTISFLNNGNIPKYKVKANDFSGALCSYLTLEVNLDGVDIGYGGQLINFDYGPVVFEAPEDWTFILTLPADAPGTTQGQTCNFNFIFYGSQVKNDLPFGKGFSDTEDHISNIASKCGECEGKVTNLTLQYDGNEAAVIKVVQKKGDIDIVFEDTVLPGDQFYFSGTDKKDTLGTEITIYVDDVENTKIHTSCSQPIGPGLVKGDFTIIAGESRSNGGLCPIEIPPVIVLNEFVPNPFGDDCQTQGLEGEWVEIYNNSTEIVELEDWYIEDGASNKTYVTTSNTHTGSTIIGPKGSGLEWLVVFLNNCILDDDNDTVKLFDVEDDPIDSYSYSGTFEEGKAFARIPDGIGFWVDPIPTPGGPNRLIEEEIKELESEPEEITELEQEELAPELTDELIEEPGEESIEEPISDEIFDETIEDEEPVGEEPVGEENPNTETGEEPVSEESTTEEEPPVEETPDTEEDPITEEAPIIEEEPIKEEVPALGDEITIEESTETSGETTDDVIEEVTEEVVEVPVAEETTDGIIIDETVSEVTEGVVEETPVDEALATEPVESPSDTQAYEVIIEAPAVDEQPAVIPDDSSSIPDGAGESVSDGESGGGGGETGVSLDGGSPTEGAGESSGDSGDAGDAGDSTGE